MSVWEILGIVALLFVALPLGVVICMSVLLVWKKKNAELKGEILDAETHDTFSVQIQEIQDQLNMRDRELTALHSRISLLEQERNHG